MANQRAIFLAFLGFPIRQTDAVFKIQDGFECWDLKKFNFNQFIDALKEKIPPVNSNVLNNYKFENGVQHHIFSISSEQYEKCSWGLLIHENLDDVCFCSFQEMAFLLNLYSPTFLFPQFYGTNHGICRVPFDIPACTIVGSQNQTKLFKSKDFVYFIKLMLPQAKYGCGNLYQRQKWDEEEWRLFVVAQLFSGLKDYCIGKNPFLWLRETADMAIILETLFTAKDEQNAEIRYRLSKRMATLLAWKFPNIECDMKKLYDKRSEFVHGSFFVRIKKDSNKNTSHLPMPDFKSLAIQKEYVRLALVAYFNLARLIKEQPDEYAPYTKVVDVLERSIMDIELRNKIIQETINLFSYIIIDYKMLI